MPIYLRRFHVDNDAYDVIFEAHIFGVAESESERVIREKYPSARIDSPPEHLPLPHFFGAGGYRVLN